MSNMVNASARKVGGIYFAKLGRFNFSFCMSKRVASDSEILARSLAALIERSRVARIKRVARLARA